MHSDELFQIHIDQILAEKSPSLAKKIPKFLVKWLMKIVHQNDINEALRYIGNDKGADAMNKLVKYFNLKIKVKGEKNIPSDGEFIFVSNHPLGGIDGICLSSFLGRKYNGKVKYIVNDILYFLKPLQPIFVPVNKHGAQSKKSVNLINEALNSDNQIITFPAGLCSRRQKGKIEDPEWKKMFILKSIEYKRDIIPIYFEGKNSYFFYMLAFIRKKLGIKVNIEMLFLPREVFRQKNKKFTIHIGKPISWECFDNSRKPEAWAHCVKSVVYEMEKK